MPIEWGSNKRGSDTPGRLQTVLLATRPGGGGGLTQGRAGKGAYLTLRKTWERGLEIRTI